MRGIVAVQPAVTTTGALMNRRLFIRTGLSLAGCAAVSSGGLGAESASALDTAHAEIWRRFIDKRGVMLDFTDLNGSVSVPTPQECRQGKPNALGWFQPGENGAMFNGL